jgi:ubiquinone/menaquinone biosynthesis C-methylase UbiE
MKSASLSDPRVEQHYSHSGRLTGAIREKLIALGKDMRALTPKDIESIDEFHIRGRAATLDLARRLHIVAGASVLDVGSGLGGPARTIAANFNCHVTGVDITEDFCETARQMSCWVGLSDRVTFVQGDAAALQMGLASFDAAVTIHAAMNIVHKDAMYAGIYKVLKPGGRLGVYDVVQGEGGPVIFPVPWARDRSISHLATPVQIRNHLDRAGFAIEDEIDSTEASAAWFRERFERLSAAGTSGLGFHLFLGSAYPEMVRNQVQNLMERRIRTVMYVATTQR